MKQEFVIVKKDVFNIFSKGVYEKREIEKYADIINISNQDYFKTVVKDVLEPGTAVKYEDHKYWVIRMDRARKSRNKEDLVISYYISRSLTDKQSDWKNVDENSLVIRDGYWFINSEGAICQAYFGDNTGADEWREMINNIFLSKEEAQDHRKMLVDERTKQLM